MSDEVIFVTIPAKLTINYIITKHAYYLINPWLSKNNNINQISNNKILLYELFLDYKLPMQDKYILVKFCLEKGANLIKYYKVKIPIYKRVKRSPIYNFKIETHKNWRSKEYFESIIDLLDPAHVNKEIAKILLDNGLNPLLKDKNGSVSDLSPKYVSFFIERFNLQPKFDLMTNEQVNYWLLNHLN